MSNQLRGAAFVRHVLAERRRVIVPLGVLFVVNVVVYGAIVRPLGQRVANIAERDKAAEQTLAAAQREYERAHGTLTGKQRASTELATFYRDVLPADLAGARRLTHLRLAQLARESNLKLERRSFEAMEERDSSLTRVKIQMVLRGTYEAMRAFIYQLETAPEFVVTDDVGLAEGSDSSGVLVLTLQLSTYFRSAGQ